MQKSDGLPHVSVIIPTYNRAHLVGETIQSVLNQTYTDYELIVLDDGSIDETMQVVAQFGDQRVTYVYQDNGGETAARNAGFAVSQGELVSFLDSDDLMLPHNLETLVSLLDARPEADIAYGWSYLADENGQPFGAPWGPTLEGQIFPELVLEETIMMGATLIRRACVEAVEGFDRSLRFQGHWDFYLRLARAGFSYAGTQQAVILLRIHPGGVSGDTEGMLAHRLALLDRIFDDPTLDPALADLHHQAYYRAYVDWSVVNYVEGHLELGSRCLNQALHYAPLQSIDIEKLVRASALLHYDSAPEVPDPVRFAGDLFKSIHPTAQESRPRQKLLGQFNAELAFRDYESGALSQVWRHALRAVIHEPSWLRNRGLARIALEGFVGPKVFDWMRSRRYSVSASFLDMAAETTSIFISPHLDDVVLSCGGTLAHLVQRKADVVLVTVVTADLAPDVQLPPLARKWHEELGLGNQPFMTRRQEDKATVEHLGIGYRWLGFLDAVYRYPELLQWDEGAPARFDPMADPIFESVRDALLQIIDEHPGATVFVPLGVGRHRDHLLVHQALEEARGMTSAASAYHYYEDYPYAAEVDPQTRLAELGWQAKPFSIDIADVLQERVRLITMHASQMRSLFGDSDSVCGQVMAYATRVGAKGSPRERFWSPAEAAAGNRL